MGCIYTGKLHIVILLDDLSLHLIADLLNAVIEGELEEIGLLPLSGDPILLVDIRDGVDFVSL